MAGLHTLRHNRRIKHVDHSSVDVDLSCVLDPFEYTGAPRFKDATQPVKSGFVRIRREGDNLLIGDKNLDVFMLDISHRLHPNIAIALFHLDTLIPGRYKLDSEGRRTNIPCREVAFRDDKNEFFWIVLHAEGPHWVVNTQSARIKKYSGKVIPVVTR